MRSNPPGRIEDANPAGRMVEDNHGASDSTANSLADSITDTRSPVLDHRCLVIGPVGDSVVRERFFFLGDHFALTRLALGRVEFDVALPFLGHVVLVEDRLDRAFGNASFAVNALLGVDVEHLVALVKAFDRAYHYAIGVFASRARFGNDVSHERGSPRKKWMMNNERK